MKSVSVGTQKGQLVTSTIGAVSFEITTKDIANGMECELSWFSDSAGTKSASPPQGITSFCTAILRDSAILKMSSAMMLAAAGTSYFKVTVDGVSSAMAVLTIISSINSSPEDGSSAWNLNEYPYLYSSYMGGSLQFYEPVCILPYHLSDRPMRLSPYGVPYRILSNMSDYNDLLYAYITTGTLSFQCEEPAAGLMGAIDLEFTGVTAMSSNKARGFVLEWVNQENFYKGDWKTGSYVFEHEAVWKDDSSADAVFFEREYYIYIDDDISFENPDAIPGKPGYTLKSGWHGIREKLRYFNAGNDQRDWYWSTVSTLPRESNARDLIWEFRTETPYLKG